MAGTNSKASGCSANSNMDALLCVAKQRRLAYRATSSEQATPDQSNFDVVVPLEGVDEEALDVFVIKLVKMDPALS